MVLKLILEISIDLNWYRLLKYWYCDNTVDKK